MVSTALPGFEAAGATSQRLLMSVMKPCLLQVQHTFLNLCSSKPASCTAAADRYLLSV
jgi:hypothetical protein